MHCVSRPFHVVLLALLTLSSSAIAQFRPGDIIRQFGYSIDMIDCVALSPDGSKLAAVDNVKVYIWDVGTEALVRSFSSSVVEYPIVAIAWSPDGTLLLAGTMGGPAVLWNAETGKEVYTSSWQVAGMHTVAFSQDGRKIFSGSRGVGMELMTYLGDTDTGEEIRSFSGGLAAVSPDDTQVLTAFWDADSGLSGAKLWDTATGEEIRAFSHGNSAVTCAEFSPDGAELLIADESEVILWNAKTGAKVHTFDHGNVFDAHFSPDGAYVISSGLNGLAVVWDVATGEEVRTFVHGEQSSYPMVEFSPDGEQLLTGSARAAVVWNVSTGEKIHTFGASEVYSVAFCPDGAQIVVNVLHAVKIFNVETGMATFVREYGYGVESVAFSPDGAQVLTGWGNCDGEYCGGALLWDVATGKEVRAFRGDGGAVYSVAFSPDGTQVLTGTGYPSSQAILWDAATGEEIGGFGGVRGRVHSVAFSPDGAQIRAGDSLGAVFWDAVTGEAIQTIDCESGYAVNSVAFSPDGTQVLICAGSTYSWEDCYYDEDDWLYDKESCVYYSEYYGEVSLWNVAAGEEVQSFVHEHYDSEPSSVAFSADGTQVLTGAGYPPNGAALWNVATGEKIHTFEGGNSWERVLSVSFSPDGTQVLSGGENGTFLWNAATGAKVLEFQGSQAEDVDSVAFSPDGLRVLTGSEGGWATLWKLYVDRDTDGIDDDWEDHFDVFEPGLDEDGDGLTNLEEYELGADPVRSDTDGDGLLDGAEAEMGTDPTDSDTDRDRIPDGAEVEIGTDPTTWDTDGDGSSDSREVEMGTDPTNPDTDGDGIGDATEVSAGTDPTNPDTDEDGIGDATEVSTGTDPTNPDTDEDGVADGVEIDSGTDPLDAGDYPGGAEGEGEGEYGTPGPSGCMGSDGLKSLEDYLGNLLLLVLSMAALFFSHRGGVRKE